MAAKMTAEQAAWPEINELLAREADLIDRRKWQDWVDLYTPDSLFWMPAWRSEDELTEDPMRELSLMYLPSRGIQDRVIRFASGDSYASTPLPTTAHVVGSVRVLSATDEVIEASAKAVVVTMDPRGSHVARGVWYEHRLVRLEGTLKIARKKVTLLERVIDGTIDVYNV